MPGVSKKKPKSRARAAEPRPDAAAAARRRRRSLAAGLLAAAALLGLGLVLSLRPASGHRVLFVGLDGGDWQLLDRLMSEGRMPNLASLVREGRSGVLQTEQPPLSPLLWTTMLTGVGPLEHGILDFARFHPGTGHKEPIPSAERQAPAVWDMASAAGRRVAVLGVWATWPAERVNGLLVSDRLFSFQRAEQAPPGAVFPAEREVWARQIVERAERETDLAQLREYLPWLEEAEARTILIQPDPYSHPASALRRILVETRVYHDLAMEALTQDKPDLAIVYIQGTDTIGHVFAPYAPPRQASIPPAEFERYSHVPAQYFAHVDRLLGEYREWARAAGAVLMLASDHGFRWSAGRPSAPDSLAAATAGRWHREEGIYLLWGPGVAPGASHAERGGVRQVCATLLALLGLAPGRGLAGPPLAGAPTRALAQADYRAGWSPPQAAEAPADGEALEKLEALGYIGAQEPRARPPGTDSTRTAASFNNEGLIRSAEGDGAGAAAAFERALALDPGLASALWNLSDLLSRENREPQRSDELLVRALAAGLPDGLGQVIGRALGCRRKGQAERASRLLDTALEVRPAESELLLLRGRWRLDAQDCAGALADFQAAAEQRPDSALVRASAGLASLCLGDEEAAASSFRRSLELDPNQPELRRALDQDP